MKLTFQLVKVFLRLLGLVSMDHAALAQSCVSQKTTKQKVLRLGTDWLRHLQFIIQVA